MFWRMQKRHHTQKLGLELRFFTPPILKIATRGVEIKILIILTDSFAGSTNILRMEAYSFHIFLRILILVISAWSLVAVNTPTRSALDSP
mmetsp:Transcript_497/g.1092  ORF Transcript_497/g.1092 Transcript_497/m.1092 type:complete len:90 (+) Transcript_497:378-647(+)